jgi:nicotinamidase-related amidase
LAPQLAGTLAPDTPVFDKHVFGLAHQPDILDALTQTNRKTAVLVGLETDVCVMHSAVGLLELGYRVAVVADSVGAPGLGHELGLDRMRSAGAIILSTKGLFYEWIRSVEAVKRFHSANADMRDYPGIEL